MELINLLLHFDESLVGIINALGPLSYVILFIIVFSETGLVVAPFLPGDSLLFAVGAVSTSTSLNFWVAYVTLLLAAVLGDTVNYWIGHLVGPRVFTRGNSKIFKKEYLDKTNTFYEKHGGKTIILARFVPIVRTFAPFVAGVGKMNYQTFISYNIIGGFIWVTLLMALGHLFGRIPLVAHNFEYVIIGIVFFSLIPMIYEFLSHKRSSKKETVTAKAEYQEITKTFKKEKLQE